MIEILKRCQCVLFLFNLIAGLSLVGCGKDLNVLGKDEDDGPDRDPIVVSEKEKIAKEHRVFCESFSKCHESIAKLVVFDKGKNQERTCTGFLVSNDVIVTSASCLPAHLRLPHANCSDDVYVHLPEVGKHQREFVGCSKILSSSFVENGQDPATVYSDLAYFSISKPMERNPFRISYSGLSQGLNYGVWRLRAENSKVGLIVKDYCSPVFNSYANPLSSNSKSPNIVMSGCRFEGISKGSPVVDSFGYVRGIMNDQLQSSIKDFFHRERLIMDSEEGASGRVGSLSFFTNMACAFTPEKGSIPSECRVDMSAPKIKQKREELLNSKRIHENFFNTLRERLSSNSRAGKYVKWIMEYDEVGLNHYKSKLVPICFDNYGSWKKSVRRRNTYTNEFPVYSGEVKLMFDENLRAFSVEKNVRNRYFEIFFQPKKLKSDPYKSKLVLDGSVLSTGLNRCP